MATTTVPTTITPEAQALAKQYGVERELEAILEQGEKSLKGLRGFHVEVEIGYETDPEDYLLVYADLDLAAALARLAEGGQVAAVAAGVAAVVDDQGVVARAADQHQRPQAVGRLQGRRGAIISQFGIDQDALRQAAARPAVALARALIRTKEE